MIEFGKLRKIGFHIVCWILLFFLNYLYVKTIRVYYDFPNQLSIFAVYAIVFYTCFYFIAPIFFAKRRLLFIVLSLALISLSTFTTYKQKTIFRSGHKTEIRRAIEGYKGEIRRRPEINNQNTLFIFNRRILLDAYVILLIYLFSILIAFIQKWQNDEKEKYVLEKEKSEAELLFLKQQINPHFLFNSLNSIYSLANKKSDLTSEAILKLSAILRYILYHSGNSLVSLNDELETLENYIELQRLRLTKKVKLTYKVEGNPENNTIEPLLLMPVFENAFKHGVDSISESFIEIFIKILDGKLTLYISNLIVPQKEISDEESGIGLKNINRRLELLYPNNYVFNIDEQNKVFKLKLELKLKT